jgi:hypothetical protein
MAVLMPYKKKRLGRAVEYDDPRGGTADKQIWTQLPTVILLAGKAGDCSYRVAHRHRAPSGHVAGW